MAQDYIFCQSVEISPYLVTLLGSLMVDHYSLPTVTCVVSFCLLRKRLLMPI